MSILGKKGHSVALDEAHEMCVNKDLKMAIIRPTKAYLQKTSLFLRYRVKAHRNLVEQLFPKEEKGQQVCIFTTTPDVKKREDNISTMMTTISEHELFAHNMTTNRGLLNVFTKEVATAEVHSDMMAFREVGIEYLKQYVHFHFLKTPSTNAPTRQHRLLTMAPKKQGKAHVNRKLSEIKQVTKCLRQRLSWCNRTGQTYDPNLEQYSIFPRAIADENGQLRYEQLKVVTNFLPL